MNPVRPDSPLPESHQANKVRPPAATNGQITAAQRLLYSPLGTAPQSWLDIVDAHRLSAPRRDETTERLHKGCPPAGIALTVLCYSTPEDCLCLRMLSRTQHILMKETVKTKEYAGDR